MAVTAADTMQPRHQQPPPRGIHPQPAGSAPMRALQLLRETHPLPVRRQSAPTTIPPHRGTPSPLPLINKSRPAAAVALIQQAPRKHPLLASKPPPPSAHSPLELLDAGGGRRHSMGNYKGDQAPSPWMRPPPPRGPRPPPASGGTTVTSVANLSAQTTKPNLQVTRDDAARRRSSDLRPPPPGLPPPGRCQSGPPMLSSGPEERSPGGGPTPSHRTVSLAANSAAKVTVATTTPLGKASATVAAAPPPIVGVVSTGRTQGYESAQQMLRRASFSKYKGPPTSEANEMLNNSVSVDEHVSNSQSKCTTTVGGEAVEGAMVGSEGVRQTQRAGNVAKSNHNLSLTQLQQRRLSSTNVKGAGRPPPPRPPGNPPPPSPDHIRRYSISNEASGGYNFSRRMSMVDSVGGGGPSPLPDVATDNSSIVGGKRKQSTPSLQGRPAVLWYNIGVTKQKEGDAVGAVECYERAAKDGHAKAQHNLAAIYEKGVPGVPKDDVEAVRLFHLAAEQRLAESSYSLAMHFKFGLGIEQDDAKCVYYLEQASEQGLAKAMFNLGLMYEKHRGISSDAPEADLLEATRECYEAAAEAGLTKAMVNLGVLYLSGRLPGHEQGEALEWFKKAADAGDLSGLWNLSLCYERGVGVARDTVAAQALQQQCRDREPRGRKPSVAGEQSASGDGLQRPRRSSEPAVSGAPTQVAASDYRIADDSTQYKSMEENRDNNDGSSNRNDINARRRSSRRRSASVPLVTPPPPQGAPPPPAPRRHPEEGSEVTTQDPIASTSSKRFSASTEQPYKNAPNDDRRRPTSTDYNARRAGTNSSDPSPDGTTIPAVETRRRGSQVPSELESPEMAVNRRTTAAVGVAPKEGAGSPNWRSPPRERKNSLLLKPTPQAIARVKAAVERRKKLQAAAASATDANEPVGQSV